MSLEKIICVKDIGKLVDLETSNLGDSFPKILLFLGGNGTGKSTLVEIFRSLALNDPKIIKGRETFSKEEAKPKIKLEINGKDFIFDNDEWSEGYTDIEIFDSIFVEKNIYSGSVVARGHYENQSEIIIGEKGVKLKKEIADNNQKLSDFVGDLKTKRETIDEIIGKFSIPMTVEKFIEIKKEYDIDNLIQNKEKEKRIAENLTEINKIEMVCFLEKTVIEIAKFERLLSSSPENFFPDCRKDIQKHIEQHIYIDDGEGKESKISPEDWLQAGYQFKKSDSCPFCAQNISSASIIQAYSSYFSELYKSFYKEILGNRRLLTKYMSNEFKNETERMLGVHQIIFEKYKRFADVDIPKLTESEVKDAVNKIKEVATFLDGKFAEKLENLSKDVSDISVRENIIKLGQAEKAIAVYNDELQAYEKEVNELKKTDVEMKFEDVEKELEALRLKKSRFDSQIEYKIKLFIEASENQKLLKKETEDKKTELREHVEEIAISLGERMNEILRDWGANFTIKYGKPDFKGRVPTVELELIIGNKNIKGRSSDDVGLPNFSNTLSAGDKSTLAFAFFLASLGKENLESKIIVMDDPFTSLDKHRRQKTAHNIGNIAQIAKQAIIFSHDEYFLKLLSDVMPNMRNQMRCIKFPISSNEEDNCTILRYINLEKEVESANRKYVRQIRNFIRNQEGDKDHMRSLLRIVLEYFYRNSNPDTFSTLSFGDIVRELGKKESLPERILSRLSQLNIYSREIHHAPINSESLETDESDLLSYCKDTIAIIEGNY